MKIFLMIIESILILFGLGIIIFLLKTAKENRPLILTTIFALLVMIISAFALFDLATSI